MADWIKRIQCWINGHKPFVTRYEPGVPGRWMSECDRCGAKYGVGLIDVVVPVIYPHNPYAGMGPEEVCESKLDAMHARERRHSIEHADLRAIENIRNTQRLFEYEHKRSTHDAFNSYDAAMTAKCLTGLET